jgi:hypothetical protein
VAVLRRVFADMCAPYDAFSVGAVVVLFPNEGSTHLDLMSDAPVRI